MTGADRWHEVGRTDNAVIYLADDRVLVVVPNCDTQDDDATARQSLEFQRAFWARRGSSGAAVILMDRVLVQTREARLVYETEPDLSRIDGFALVTSSPFGRALASVFMGLRRPPVPTRMFSDVNSAIDWARQLGGAP